MRWSLPGVILMMTWMVAACSKERMASPSEIERGKYLVTPGGCHDCHTPKISGSNGVPVLVQAVPVRGQAAVR